MSYLSDRARVIAEDDRSDEEIDAEWIAFLQAQDTSPEAVARIISHLRERLDEALMLLVTPECVDRLRWAVREEIERGLRSGARE